MATIPLKTITFPGLDNTYTVPQLDDTLTTAGKAADAKATGDRLDELEASEATKANIDGSYEQMTVGNAEQLVSSIKEEDKVPYVFRTSGGSIDIGDREEDKIVGGTVAWNQLVRNGDFTDTSMWDLTGTNMTVQNNVATVTASVGGQSAYVFQVVTIPIGHKIFYTVDIKSDSENVRNNISFGSSETLKAFFTLSSNWQTVSGIWNKSTSNVNFNIVRATIPYTLQDAETINVKNVCIFDLTQMFGSTIANYIYSLEQATAGAGVAWFRKLFPNPYYSYDAGTLKHVSGLVSHDMTGFNQWDKSGAISGGYLTENGGVASSENFKYTDYIRIVPNTTYHFQNIGGANPSICWYDAAKQFISGTPNSEAIAKNLTSPANAQYVRVSFPKGNVDILCVNIHWDGSRDGEYEPYTKHSYPLDSTLTLRGIPKLDSNNQIYYDGDEYESDGTVTRRYGIVNLGMLTWEATDYSAEVRAFQTNLTNKLTGAFNVICGKYTTATPGHGAGLNMVDKTICGTSYDTRIAVRDTTYSDAATFKAGMSGVYLVYELATPTTETADPYQNPQIVDDFGTEEYVIDNTVIVPIPVGHDTFYQANLVAKLEMAPNSPEGDGDYIVRQTNGENAYVPITFPADELPAAPTTDGNYVLKCTVASGTATFTWEAQS